MMDTQNSQELDAPLSGKLIRLVPLSERHLGELDSAFRGDDDLWTWTLTAAPRTQAETVAWIERAKAARDAGARYAFAIESIDDGTLAGVTNFLDVRRDDGVLEIGSTLIFSAYRGTRVNTELTLLLLARAFDCGFVRVTFKTDARNARSRAALERLGATPEGVLRSFQRRHDGTTRDTAMYSILVAEWPVVRAQLEAKLA